MSIVFALAGAFLGMTADVQESPYQVGDQVELKASGNHWQKCIVTDPGSDERVMRMRCEPYQGAGYSRGGGVYVESPNSTSVRKAAPEQPAQQPAQQPQPAAPPAEAAAPASGGGYQVGQAVEIEASKHWVPCTVSDIQMYGDQPMIRVRCTAYPALSRGAGVFIVHDAVNGIRPATGQTGPAPEAAAPERAGPGPGSSLRTGEYACYGSGGRIMAGLKFNITGPASYTDAYGAAGRYRITGTTVNFTGGALGGMTGYNLKSNNSFTMGSQASCEYFG
ncbi:MAG: hypothetical protein EOP60_09365 [Sphingomonadales bacterium]|nr:MAG: hypothetical protein EOP60_09365 [Sphingomonadales bacterium]